MQANQFKRTDRPTWSKWGQVDQATELCPGAWLVSTPSHGGILLSAELNALVPAAHKALTFGGAGRQGVYEEDCDACFALLALEPLLADPIPGYGPKARCMQITREMVEAFTRQPSIPGFLDEGV